MWSYDVLKLKKLIQKTYLCFGNGNSYHLINDDNMDINEPILNDYAQPDTVLDFDQSLIEKITEMGFTHQQAVDALKNNGGDLERAVNSLF